MPLRPKRDVSAVVLTIGEPTTQEAIDCLAVQTLPLSEILVVRGTKPFYRALNEAARSVQTPFFVQVDADMLLDAQCVARLRRAVRRDTGIVVGQLRDTLIGRVVGVKLFRQACFSGAQFRDSVAQDTDFAAEIGAVGWKSVYIGRSWKPGSEARKTYGEHRPSYTPEYTFRKYLLEGRRYRYRESPGGIRWHFSRLEASHHPCAVIAQVALAQGIFNDESRDMLGRAHGDQFAEVVEMLREAPSDDPTQVREAAPTSDASRAALDSPRATTDHVDSLRELFQSFSETGADLRRTRDVAAFERQLVGLGETRRDTPAWIAKVGVCRGLCGGDACNTRSRLDGDWNLLKEFLATREPEHPFRVDGRRRFDGLIRGVRRALVG